MPKIFAIIWELLLLIELVSRFSVTELIIIKLIRRWGDEFIDHFVSVQIYSATLINLKLPFQLLNSVINLLGKFNYSFIFFTIYNSNLFNFYLNSNLAFGLSLSLNLSSCTELIRFTVQFAIRLMN